MNNSSGIVIEKSKNLIGTLPNGQYAQRIKLPQNYARGETVQTPDLTGFQIFVETESDEIEIDWSLQQTVNRQNEVQKILLNGSTASYRLRIFGEETESLNFDASDAEIQEALEALSSLAGNVVVNNLKITFVNRLSKTNVPLIEVLDNSTVAVVEFVPPYNWFTRASNTETIKLDVESNKAWASVAFAIEVTEEDLAEDWRFLFSINGAQPYYFIDDLTREKAETESEAPVVASGSNSIVIAHRLLADILDEGIDFLGNNYRGAAKNYSPKAVSSGSDTFWMSRPNPSSFAVESLYFDVRVSNNASVINKVLIDPLTLGVSCNLYYSNEIKNMNGPEDWDELLWTPIPKTIKLTARQEHTMPVPVTASFIKLEFTNLQAKSYYVGPYQQKTIYKKHPKWVLDYFYDIYLERKEKEIAAQDVTLSYNALRLYYNYFIDDLIDRQVFPALVNLSADTKILKSYIEDIGFEDLKDLDGETLGQIQLASSRYTSHPLLSAPNTLLKNQYFSDPTFYPTEVSASRVTADTELVTSEDRDAVKMDRSFPTMSFYLPSRHKYRRSRAMFENDRAYFAGIKEVSFLRDYYASEIDQPFYSETAGDEVNLETNDLVFRDGAWTGS